MRKPAEYRAFIDEMVEVCRDGQGQIGARRAREGLWNENATADFLPDQHAVNLLLRRLDSSEREVLARLLASEVVTGVFETIKALEEFQIAPFVDGYEGSPYHDFIGRLDGWEWPTDS